jgi:hypothetical protein
MIVPIKISIEIGGFHLNYNINLELNPETKEILDIIPDPNYKGGNTDED